MVTISIAWARDHRGRSLGFAQVSVTDDAGGVATCNLDDNEDLKIELEMSTDDGSPTASHIIGAVTED